MERLVVLSQGDVINREAAARALGAAKGGGTATVDADAGLRGVLEDAEREAIRRALAEHGSTRKAARALGINQSTVVRKARRYGLTGV